MTDSTKYIVGTSGYSFADWVGSFYPPGTQSGRMLDEYVQHFQAVELNFSYYRIPAAATLERIAAKTPEDFTFWIKANRKTTHEQDRSIRREYLAGVEPLVEANKLAGVLLQFPQSFHRTAQNRAYLAAAIDDFSSVPLAVEFRHHSWDQPATEEGLRERNVTLVVPDVPELAGLYRRGGPVVTTATGYLRLHSRNAANWYRGGTQRYDYNYDEGELAAILADWSAVEGEVDKVYTFFNNCHGGQAARNAETFRKLVGQI